MERHNNDTGSILKCCVILQGSHLKTNFQNSIYYLFYIPDTTLFCAVLVILGCTLEALTSKDRVSEQHTRNYNSIGLVM